MPPSLGRLFSHTESQNASVYLVVLGIVAICIIHVAQLHYHTRRYLAKLLGWVINIHLCYVNPIQHEDTSQSLPTVPYEFPNGQGNIEKFLQGRANSAKWQQQYGGLYRIWSGFSGEIVLTKAHHVKLVFQDSHRHTKAHANNSGYLMEQLLGSCAGLISGNSWKAVKQAVQEPFLHKHTSVYVEDVRTFVHDYLRTRIPNETEQHGLQKFHIIHDLKFIPFLFVARIIFGPLSVGLERKLEALIPQREALFRKVIQGGMSRFALLRHLPLSEMNELRDFKRRWKSWNDEAHTHALLNATDSNGAPILDMYADMETGKITQEQLLQTIDEILFANLDVMMNGLSWVLVFLAANISVQADLREEIRANESPELRATYLSGPGLSSTTLLTACILESARLRPAAAFSVPQSCPTARNLDGYEVPAGTNFVIDSYALNIRDPFWGKDRDKFQPRRWKKLANNRDLRYQYWRFGFGPRTCMGKYVADLILKATIVEVLNKWQISLSDTTKGFSHQTDKGMPRADEDCDMDWPWDDEMWIHHPDMTLYCTAFSPNVP